MIEWYSMNGQEFPLPEANSKTPVQWHAYCASLLTEIERLRGFNTELLQQRRALAQMVPVPEDVKALAGKSYEDIMALCQDHPSLEDIIRECEKDQGNS